MDRMIFFHNPKPANPGPAAGRLISLLLAVALLFLLTAPPAGANVLRNFSHGDTLPGFSLPALDGGKKLEVQPAGGKPTALVFFSIRPDFRKKRSLALLSVLAELAKEYKTRANIVGVYVDGDDAEVVRKYMRDSAIRLPVLLDYDRAVYNQYGVFMMPLVVLAAANGSLHEVIPYTYNIKEIVDGNLKLLLGIWTEEQLKQSLAPKEKVAKSEQEKEYIRRVNYGRVMVARKMYSQAEREFSTAIRLLPDAVPAYVELGRVYLARKKWDRAIKVFKEALAKNSESDGAIAGLGLALYGKGELDEALPQLESAFIAPEPELEVIVALADIHERKGNITKAIRLNKLAVARLLEMYHRKWK